VWITDVGGEAKRPMVGEVLSADGVVVRYELSGRGSPALVLVHGWSCDRSYWCRQVEHFADRHAVLTVDLAGHGESGTGRRLWTMASFGEDVVAVIDSLHLRSVVLVGHSMGGDVVVEAARCRRERVLGLVWIDTYRSLGITWRDESDADEITAFIAPFRTDFAAATRAFVRRIFGRDADPGLIEWVAEDMAAASPEIALDALQHAFTNKAAAITGLREADLPVVAINPALPPTDVESLARHGVATTQLPDVGHFVMMEDPVGFNRILGEVIERFATGSRSEVGISRP
jgi:pimeloyl-ACP methyl ester carboxylesterase